MADDKTLTSANSKITLTVPGLGLLPFTLQGYTADAMFAFDPVETGETTMGADGKMSAGFVPTINPQNITLQADSSSRSFFDAWDGGEKLAKEKFFAQGVVDLPGLGQSFVLTKGALKRVTRVPPGGKIMGPATYTIDWADVQPTPLVNVGG